MARRGSQAFIIISSAVFSNFLPDGFHKKTFFRGKTGKDGNGRTFSPGLKNVRSVFETQTRLSFPPRPSLPFSVRYKSIEGSPPSSPFKQTPLPPCIEGRVEGPFSSFLFPYYRPRPGPHGREGGRGRRKILVQLMRGQQGPFSDRPKDRRGLLVTFLLLRSLLLVHPHSHQIKLSEDPPSASLLSFPLPSDVGGWMGAGEVQIGRRTLPSSAYSRSFTRWAIPEKTLSTTFSKTQMVQFKGWNKAGQVCKVCFSQMNRRMSLPFLALFSPVCTLGHPDHTNKRGGEGRVDWGRETHTAVGH